MKKILLSILALLLLLNPKAHGQVKLPEFGKIDIADLKMTECDFEKGADAMDLFKTESVSLESNPYYGFIKTATEFRARIKIFSEKGFKAASIEIPYPGKSEAVKISDVEAVIYNLDSADNIVVQKLDKTEIFREKSKSRKSQNSIRFTFPGLRKGSVIEYRYTKTNRSSIYVPPWLFQDEIPCRYSKCSVKIPGYTEMAWHITGSSPVDKDSLIKKYANTAYNEATRGFAMRNIPSFKEEPFMSSFKDNLQRVEFSITPESFFSGAGTNLKWDLCNDWLMSAHYFGRQFYVDIDSTGAFVDSVKALKQTTDKITALMGYIRKRVSWNGDQDFYPADVAECWKNKTGNSADMNLLLVNMLHKINVQCYPILLSTRENGMVDQSFPSLNQFDAVDVLVVDSPMVYVLDCAQKNLSFKTTPYDAINRQAFIIDNRYSKWINIWDNRTLMQTDLNINAVMDSAGTLNGFGNITYTGIAKEQTLKEEEKEEKDKSNDHNKDLVGDDAGDLKIDSLKALHDDDDNDSLIHKINFHSELSNTDNIYFLNPFMFSMFKKNPFKDTSRNSDIDFGAKQTYTTKIHVILPENFSLEELPKSMLIRSEDSSIMFKREILSAGNQLLVRIAFIINRPQFDKDEYGGLKSFFDKVYALINEQVVLKKTE